MPPLRRANLLVVEVQCVAATSCKGVLNGFSVVLHQGRRRILPAGGVPPQQQLVVGVSGRHLRLLLQTQEHIQTD